MREPGSSRALVAAAPALRARLPELTRSVVAAVELAVPIYRDTRLVEAGSLAESVRANLEQLLTAFANGRPVKPTEPGRTGQLRARQGVPLPDMLLALRIGASQLWTALAEELERSGTWTQHDLTLSATALWWAVGECTSAAVETYRETVAERTELRERRRSALIEALLSGGGGMEQGAVWEIASKLGLPRDGLFATVVAEVGEIGAEALPGVATRLREEGVESVWRLQPGMQIGVLWLGRAGGEPSVTGAPSVTDSSQPRALDVVTGVLTALGTSARIGVSPAYTDLEHTPRAVYLARIALHSITAPTLEGQPRVQRFAATPLATLVAAAPEAAVQVARSVLGPLLRLPRDEQDLLLDTLEVWLATGGSAKETAQRLYCHPNTVRHRLRRIAEHTGRSVEHPAEAVDLSTALYALRLLPEVR